MLTPQTRSRVHDSCQPFATAGLTSRLAVQSSSHAHMCMAMIGQPEHLDGELCRRGTRRR